MPLDFSDLVPQDAPVTGNALDPGTLGRAQAVYQGLIARGMDVPTAVGYAANAVQESRADPNTHPGDMGAAHGTFMWRGDRLGRYQALYGHDPEQGDLDEHLDYVTWENEGPEAEAWKKIQAAPPNAEAKAAAISQHWERPKDTEAEMDRRSWIARHLISSAAAATPPKPALSFDDLIPKKTPEKKGPLSFDDLIPSSGTQRVGAEQGTWDTGEAPPASGSTTTTADPTGENYHAPDFNGALAKSPSVEPPPITGDARSALETMTEFGPSVSQPGTDHPPSIGDRAFRAAKQAWDETEPSLTQEGQRILTKMAESGGVKGYLAAYGSTALHDFDILKGILGAAFKGGQELTQVFLEQVPGIGEQGARDLAAMPEAFMGSPHPTGVPRVPRLTPAEAAAMREARDLSRAPLTLGPDAGAISPGEAEVANREAWHADMERQMAAKEAAGRPLLTGPEGEPSTTTPSAEPPPVISPRPTRNRPVTPEQAAIDEAAGGGTPAAQPPVRGPAQTAALGELERIAAGRPPGKPAAPQAPPSSPAVAELDKIAAGQNVELTPATVPAPAEQSAPSATAPTRSFPVVPTHPVPDNSGAMTNLSDEDYFRFMRGEQPPPIRSAPTRQSGSYEMFDPRELTLAPKTFQYKEANDRGVTGALQGVARWEPALANPITVWQSNDGQNYVVNGHQRTDLALRAQEAGQPDVQMPAQVFREADGYTPEYMRALGAYQNIAEGSGTAIDAAKVLRGNPISENQRLPGLPPRSQLVQQGTALAKLSDDAFGMVTNEIVPAAYAAHVGNLISDPAEQLGAMRVLARAEPANSEQARIMVQDARDSGFARGVQTGLFGDEDFARSLIPERAKVLDRAMRTIRQVGGVFRAAVEGEDSLTSAGNTMDTAANTKARTENERLLDTLHRNATTRGPISDAINTAAADLATGKPIAAVASRFLGEIRRLVRSGQDQGIQSGDLSHGAEPAGEKQPLPPIRPLSRSLSPEERARINALPLPRRDYNPAPIDEPPEWMLKENRGTVARTPELTIQNDPNQATMPGMEPSARQAQAARDAQGPRSGQEPADQGLFAPPEISQSGLPLYSFPGMLFDPASWRGVVKPVRDLAKSIMDRPTATMARDAVTEFLAPMHMGSKEAAEQAFKFANAIRQWRYHSQQVAQQIRDKHTIPERWEMGRAQAEQSVFERKLAREMGAVPDADKAAFEADARKRFDATGAGHAGLKPEARNLVQGLSRVAAKTWDDLRSREMVNKDAEGWAHWMPRQLVMMEPGGKARRIIKDDSIIPGAKSKPGSGSRDIHPFGTNMHTDTPGFRNYEEVDDTLRAARAKYGPNVHLMNDILGLVGALERENTSISGHDLLEGIKNYGTRTGTVTAYEGGARPGFTVAGNPAMWRSKPKFFTNEEGETTLATTPDGKPIFERVPVWVHDDFRGPVEAVFRAPPGKIMKAFMALKALSTHFVMQSPLTHLQVELGRAMPLLAGRTPVVMTLASGRRARMTHDPRINELLKHGMAPITGGFLGDPVALMNEANYTPPLGKLGQSVIAARDALAKGASKLPAGEFFEKVLKRPIQTLLWNRVLDLQVSIGLGMAEDRIKAGWSPEAAYTAGAHLANRYAGALPPEGMSRLMNTLANVFLFSRSFTGGNLGVMKDTLTGAPKHVLDHIGNTAGPEAEEAAKAWMKHKARTTFVADIILYWGLTTLIQHAATAVYNSVMGNQPEESIYEGYVRRFHEAMKYVADHPIKAMFPPNDIANLMPTADNEPGKENRSRLWPLAGTSQYLYERTPVGKVGEELLDWLTEPVNTVMRKQSTLSHGVTELLTGKDNFGQDIRRPGGDDGAANVARSTVRMLETMFPVQLESDVYTTIGRPGSSLWGEPPPTRRERVMAGLQAVGAASGLASFSRGYPAGPIAGYEAMRERQIRFDVAKVMPTVRRLAEAGQTDEATKKLIDVGMDPRTAARSVQYMTPEGMEAGAARKAALAERKALRRGDPGEIDRMETLRRSYGSVPSAASP